MTDQLTEEQVELLYAARDLDGEARVIDAQTLEETKDLLGTVLEHTTGINDGKSLPLEAQVRQLRDDVKSGETSIETLNLSEKQQQPESGGATQDELESANPFDDRDRERDLETALDEADQATRHDAVATLAKAASIENRLPERASTLRDETADALGLEAIEPDAIADAGLPTDPRRV